MQNKPDEATENENIGFRVVTRTKARLEYDLEG